MLFSTKCIQPLFCLLNFSRGIILFSACADGRIESIKDFGTSSAPVIVRKDVEIQTGPDISRSSSPSMRSSFSCSLSVHQVKELEDCFSNLEIRDAQVDDWVDDSD